MRRLPRLCATLAATLLLAAVPRPAPVVDHRPAPAGAVRVTIETLGIDRRGTWSLGLDVADLLPGGTGVLEKSATLQGRAARAASEMVAMTVRVAATLETDGGCALRLETETRGVESGARAGAKPRRPDRTRATFVLKAGEERLVDVYASTATEGRLALKIGCGEPPPISPESAPRLIEFSLTVSRAEGDLEPALLKGDELRALLGREAGTLFSFNVTLPPDAKGEKRYRREKLEVNVRPVLMSGGRVQVALGVHGELATVSADATATHPIQHTGTLILASGEKRDIEIDVRSSGAEEGWERVRYRLALSCFFRTGGGSIDLKAPVRSE